MDNGATNNGRSLADNVIDFLEWKRKRAEKLAYKPAPAPIPLRQVPTPLRPVTLPPPPKKLETILPIDFGRKRKRGRPSKDRTQENKERMMPGPSVFKSSGRWVEAVASPLIAKHAIFKRYEENVRCWGDTYTLRIFIADTGIIWGQPIVDGVFPQVLEG